MGPGFGSFPRGSSYPSLFLPYCCKYFNKMEKEKKKDKKKVRKSHHLKPPGTCGPGQPGLSPEQSSGQPWQPGLPVCVHPSRGGQPPEQLFTLQRQNKSRSNSETKNLSFPALVLSPLLCPPCISQPPGACTSLPAPGPEACPLPHWPGDIFTPKDAFAKMAALPL